MNHSFTFLALDLAQQRSREAADARRAQEVERGLPAHPGALRSALAAGLALVVRGSAAVVRKLDASTADELASRMARAAR